MGKRIYPLQRIRDWYCYDLDDICALYKTQGLHQQTIRSWLKKGLASIDNARPTLIFGADLRKFLGEQNTASKCLTAFAEMFCMKCKDARPVFQRQIAIEQANRCIKAKGQCRNCKTSMNKSYALADLPKLRTTFHVGDVLELYDCRDSPLNTHLKHCTTSPSSEPVIRDLFA